MKKKTILIASLVLLGIVFGTISLAFIRLPYLQKAILYFTPGINDYTIFENRKVEARNPLPWKIASDYNRIQIPKKYRSEVEKNNTVAWLLVQDGEIIFEQYWDGYSDSSYSNSFSMAKTIVALLVGIALEEGKIKSLQQSVGEFLPAYAEGEKSRITIEHLLIMSSGLNWNESYINPFAHTAEAYYGEDIASTVMNLDVVETPGKKFKYLSGNTQLLAYVVQAATGKKLSEYASEKLWTPLGAERPALWSLDKADGDEKAYCCFNSNARDFARLGQLILQKGVFNNTRILSEDYINKMTTPYRYLEDTTQIYGYQIWIADHKGHKIPYLRGILGQYVAVFPHKNAVFVRLGHLYTRSKVNGHHPDFLIYLDCVDEMLEMRKKINFQ
ncbi:MAG: beta-lactamase family protein [Cytophagales bacterium]|nr:beta-lactamase family protein [Cytophagales bacterium]MDW8384613.1 serine hydrolase [Flammeovirgaceae bacterium]